MPGSCPLTFCINNMKRLVQAIFLMITAVSLATAIISILQLRASNLLLSKISLAQPDTYLPSITNQLGQFMYEITDPDEMVRHGGVKDLTYCAGKKLFTFYASTPPCRTIDIYTDTNNIIILSTWHGL